MKATWSKFPSCSCGQLVTHNCIRHSVLNGQFDDRCLLSLRSFETGQWCLGPKRCNFSKRFVVFKTSSGWMYMFLVTYSCVQVCFFAIALFSLWKLLPFMKLLRIFLYLLSFLGNQLIYSWVGSGPHQVSPISGTCPALLLSVKHWPERPTHSFSCNARSLWGGVLCYCPGEETVQPLKVL